MKIYVVLGIWLISVAACQPDSKPKGWPLTDTLANERLRVAVDAAAGGRISSFRVDGEEILQTTRDTNGWQWGSTVWLSPQRAWGWPPPATFDAAPYVLTRTGERELLLTSAVDSATQLQLTKRLLLRDTALALTLTLYNRGDTLRNYGLWSNTRLPYAGQLKFTPGDSIRVEKIDSPVAYRKDFRADIHFDERHPKNGKVFSNLTTGGVHYYTSAGTRFTQTTPYLTYAEVAPDQAPLEVYLAPEDGFAEFELQGPYGPIAPGDSLVFGLLWSGE